MNRPTSQLILRKRQSLESWQVSLPKTGDNLGFENFLKKWGEVIGGDADGSAAAFVGALWAWKLNKDKGGMNAEFWSDARGRVFVKGPDAERILSGGITLAWQRPDLKNFTAEYLMSLRQLLGPGLRDFPEAEQKLMRQRNSEIRRDLRRRVKTKRGRAKEREHRREIEDKKRALDIAVRGLGWYLNNTNADDALTPTADWPHILVNGLLFPVLMGFGTRGSRKLPPPKRE
jgi:hypothetical protein